MSSARSLFEAGRLSEALDALNGEVKARPSDSALRTFLFELLCIVGELDRAARQLDVLASQAGDPGVEMAIHGYRALLAAERQRSDVFVGAALPKFIVEPGAAVEPYLLLISQARTATAGDLEALVETAEAGLPAMVGTRNGHAFQTFRDVDDRTAAVLEVFHEGEYLWVPIAQVASLSVAAPRRLRDTVWAQATLELVGRAPGQVMLPVRYVGSESVADDAVRLGRTTEWTALHDCLLSGVGQHSFSVDDEDVPLLELGTIVFTPSTGAEGV